MNRVNVVYAAVLKFAGMEVDDKGYVSNVIGDRKDPANINGKRIVLPYDNQLKNFNPDEKVIFHPLTENILRGESEAIQKLKDVINIRLNYTIGMLGQQLLTIVASEELHSQLNPDQSELFINIKECDAKTINNWITLMVSGAKSKADRIFTNIYLKRGGTLHEKRYARVGVVSFPFYDEIVNGKVDKIRVKDNDTFKQLFKFMFPGIDNPYEYSYGSNNQTAPYLDCLMNTAAKIASRLNDLLEEYGTWIEDSKSFMFDPEWVEYFNDLNAYEADIRQIPMQQGNEGSFVVPENRQLAVPNNPAPNPTQPALQNKPPAVEVTERGVDFKSLMASNPGLGSGVMPQYSPQFQPQPQYNCAPPAFALPPSMQPQPMYPPQQPMYPQQYPQQPPQYTQQYQPQPYQQYPQQYPQQPPQYPQGGYAQNRLYG